MMKLKDKILEVILNNKYFRNLVLEDMYEIISEPIAGLYDANNNLLCTWEESRINIEKDYQKQSTSLANYYSKTETSAYYVLTNNYPTATKVILPEGITKIGNLGFYQCNVTNIKTPNSIINIGVNAFTGGELINIEIPINVTSIGQEAFRACYNLTSIVMYSNVTNIELRAFYDCKILKTIYYTGTQEQWNAISKGNNWNYGCPSNMQIIYNYIP